LNEAFDQELRRSFRLLRRVAAAFRTMQAKTGQRHQQELVNASVHAVANGSAVPKGADAMDDSINARLSKIRAFFADYRSSHILAYRPPKD